MHAVLRRERGHTSFSMLLNSFAEVVRHAGVKCSRPACKNVNAVSAIHRRWREPTGTMPQELREVQTVEEKQTTVAEADSRSLTAIRERRGWVRDDNVKQSQSQKKNESKKTNCRVWSRA